MATTGPDAISDDLELLLWRVARLTRSQQRVDLDLRRLDLDV